MSPIRLLEAVDVAVPAGFPSPAQDYQTDELDLNEHLIRDRLSTFIMRVTGSSMIDAGIADGDEVIVDRGIEPVSGNVVVAAVAGEFTIKRFIAHGDHGLLRAENPAYPDLPLGPETDFQIFGVVTRCLHRP